VILTVSVLFVGCGEDEEGQVLVGTWVLENIDGAPLFTEEELNKVFDTWDTGETEEDVYIESVTEEFTFSDVGEGKFNMDVSIKFKMGEHVFIVKVTVSGPYTVSDSNITMVNKSQTVDVDLPQELIEKGFTEDDAKEIAGVEEPFEEKPLEGTYTVSGNTLTIKTTDGETLVFKKK